MTFGISVLAMMIGCVLANLIHVVFFFLPDALAISLGVSSVLCFACSFFKVQDF